MLTAQEYRNRNRKVIDLPGGGQVEIRKLSVRDFLDVGDIPEAFLSGDTDQRAKVFAENKEFAEKFVRACVLRGVVSIKIVDKRPQECREDEVSWDEVPPGDVNFIVSEVSKLTGMTREAGKSAGRFPEEPGSPGDGGGAG